MTVAARVSVVIPTRNEASNVKRLLSRLGPILTQDDEVTFVDDGSDELPAVVSEEAATCTFATEVVRREVPTGGLAGAVVEGILRSRHDLVIVMDGDLQHPPETIIDLVEAADGADVVVASRYRSEGSASGLDNFFRRAVSHGSGWTTRILFPIKLRGCTDPMSGFFLVRRSRINFARLQPQGFKILLEILCRSPRMVVAEVPFRFDARQAGESNASAVEALAFARQVYTLRTAEQVELAALVGVSGIAPNLIVSSVMRSRGFNPTLSAVLASEVAIGWNFVVSDLASRPAPSGMSRARRFGYFWLVNQLDLLRLPIARLLVRRFEYTLRESTLVTVGMSFGLRYLASLRSSLRADGHSHPRRRAIP